VNSVTTSTAKSHLETTVELDVRGLITQLRALQQAAHIEVDWQLYCEIMRKLCKAERSAIVMELTDSHTIDQRAQSCETIGWQPMTVMPPGSDLLPNAKTRGYAHAPARDEDGRSWLVLVLALQGIEQHFLILNIEPQHRNQLNEIVLRGLLCSDFNPAPIQNALQVNSPHLGKMLALAAEVSQQERFESACLSLVNGLVVAWELKHASLAWLDGRQIKMAAISHLDRFESDSYQTQLIEKAMAPALIEGNEVWWPDTEARLIDSTAMLDVAELLGSEEMVAVPILNTQGRPCGALLLGYATSVNRRSDLEPLYISLELLRPRLQDLWAGSLSLPRRIRRATHNASQRLFGPEQPLLKLSGLGAFFLLAYMVFGTWNYRVDATANITTDETQILSAQFDGRIDRVSGTAGDWVADRQVLATMDTKDLQQQRKELEADVQKAETEINKSRAERRMADTDIAQARLNQALARRSRIDNNISEATIQAPFSGVIVEGESKELLGAPVKKGDKLFRIAKIEGFYVSLLVSEREMRHITPQAKGEFVLISNPDAVIAIRITSLIPIAKVNGQEGNQFLIKAELLEPPAQWWRPGMTGLARIEVGERNVAWILTHRLVDGLRLKLWW
jgi:hypothetical protein